MTRYPILALFAAFAAGAAEPAKVEVVKPDSGPRRAAQGEAADDEVQRVHVIEKCRSPKRAAGS